MTTNGQNIEAAGARLSVETLRAITTTTEEVPLPGLGGSVLIRGITRDELVAIVKKHTDDADKTDTDAVEAETICAALVDPVLTEEDVRHAAATWPAGAFAALQKAVMQASGLEAEAAQAATIRFPERA